MKDKIMVIGAMDIFLIKEAELLCEFINLENIPVRNENVYMLEPKPIIKVPFTPPPTRADRRRGKKKK